MTGHVHADAVLAGIASFGTTAAVAAQAPPTAQAETWLPYLISIVGPVLVLVANRLLAAKAAGKRTRANSLDAEAAKEVDADKARGLRLEAIEDRAEADALEALKHPP